MKAEHDHDPRVVEPWGKSAFPDSCHPLVCHAIDTFAVALRLGPKLLRGRLRTALEESFGPLENTQSWVAFFCGLHDLGKYSPAFQSLNLSLAKARIGPWGSGAVAFVAKPVGLTGRVDAPHGILTAFHLRNLLSEWGATEETAIDLAAVLGGHHGCFPSGQDVQQIRSERNSHGEQPWAAARTELVMRLAALCGLPDPRTLPWGEVRLSRPAAVGLAAVTTVSDWVASDKANFQAPPAEFDLEAYATEAHARAEKAVARLGLTPWVPPPDPGFRVLFGEDPRPVQKVVEEVVGALREPALIVVEAPTGEGKTKAVLQAGAKLVQRLDLAGIYIGLPTQASSMQTRTVVCEMLEHLGDETGVSLVHAGAREVLEELAKLSEIGIDEGDSAATARAWFTRKRSLLAVLGSGTIDQLLKAAFRGGHVFVRLAGLAGKVVVIDEVHAYDTYMSTLLQRVLVWLGALGVPVVLLSATLPAGRRHALVSAWQAGARGCRSEAIPVTPSTEGYPRVTVAGAHGAPREYGAGLTKLNRERLVHLKQVADDEVVDWLLGEAAKDRCVAVVHNMVYRAIDTFEKLERRIAELPEAERPLLLAINGSLPRAERLKVDNALRESFGAGVTRPRRAIVVGTQVLEQSLDLDFDGLLTDLAPIDALFQRLGRVHRHLRNVPRGDLVLAITGVTDTSAGPEFPRYLHSVYARSVLMRTWAAVKDLESIDSWPKMAELVDKVYEDRVPCPAGWESGWSSAAQRLEAARDNDQKAAEHACLPFPHRVSKLEELTERPGQARTRKGRRR
ncbi:CRISPR-associated Cas3 family helicase [Amycolatopsis sulphurea]|uniref:CRISPR-associated Cas3 family helicase n=1 Tax=Amycolatopsis sulphurea TaxID=76022 RepID=A0A2A9G094_9PSEU|nr:CRISPR-associated helicase/endonuclease Cas3 [Amycolatopsis sulphurea]PFG57147.1 CRISPR-associated Cas3 family helicase [Amycolatopsis sulphurea]